MRPTPPAPNGHAVHAHAYACARPHAHPHLHARPGLRRLPPTPPLRWAALAVAVLSLLSPAASPTLRAADLLLDFATLPPGAPPATFRPALTGGGPPPDWRITQVDAASAFTAVTEQARPISRETVLAQLSQ
ncbi:MAG: hypothetical protein Q7T30_01945, partial [Planctomycetota bacterium]|nr:hypothetical protein [Planctomycetota bacterium]